MPNIFRALGVAPPSCGLLDYHDALMDSDDRPSKAERELVGSATSGANQLPLLRGRPRRDPADSVQDAAARRLRGGEPPGLRPRPRQRAIGPPALALCADPAASANRTLRGRPRRGADRGRDLDVGAITALFAARTASRTCSRCGPIPSSSRALLWKLDGLSEYDVRRPLVPTGTNLLGLVKHVASVASGYFGDTFGRPFAEALPWLADGRRGPTPTCGPRPGSRGSRSSGFTAGVGPLRRHRRGSAAGHWDG